MRRTIAFIDPHLTTRNVGDHFIEDSVRRILDYDEEGSVRVDPRTPVTGAEIEAINRCDAAVIVGTNLWYRSMKKPGRWTFTSEQLRRIRVPVIPLGVGTTRHEGDDNGFDGDTLEQLRIIHGSCVLASARDERTAEALGEAGLDNVVMTGCPTLYRSLEPTWTLRLDKPTRRLVVTVRKGQRRNVRGLLDVLARRGWSVVVAAQQRKDRFVRSPWPPAARRPETVYEYDVRPYLALVRDAWGAIGWRLHGNMLHLAHGNPAVFFANCSRAQSFCRSFGLPCVVREDHRVISRGELIEAAERLEDPSTFGAFPRHYSRYRAEMARFLDANDLGHRLGGPASAELSSGEGSREGGGLR